MPQKSSANQLYWMNWLLQPIQFVAELPALIADTQNKSSLCCSNCRSTKYWRVLQHSVNLREQTGFPGEAGEVGLWARADVADDLGGGEAGEAAGFFEVEAL